MRQAVFIKTNAVIRIVNFNGLGIASKGAINPAGLRMLDGVVDHFLNHPVKHDLHVFGQPFVSTIEVQPDVDLAQVPDLFKEVFYCFWFFVWLGISLLSVTEMQMSPSNTALFIMRRDADWDELDITIPD